MPRFNPNLIGTCLGFSLLAAGCASIQSDEHEDDYNEVSEMLANALANPWPEPFPMPEDFRTVDELVGAEAPEPAEPEGPWERLQAAFALPDVDRALYADELRRYDGNQAFFNLVARNGEPYLEHVIERIEDRGLPGEIALVAMVESAFRPFAYSHARAGGLWQFQPATGTRFGLEQNWWYDGRRDVVASTEAAMDYLEYLHDFFDGDWLLAFAAYNAGEGRVSRAARANAGRGEPEDYWNIRLPAETRAYVPRILALRTILRDPEQYGVTLPAIDENKRLAVVEIEQQIDLALAAELAGVSPETIYRYNPGFNRWASPPAGPHRLAVPESRAEDFRAALTEADTSDMLRWERHQVQSGETLSHIARNYGTTVSALREVNDLGPNTPIRAGGHLVVPIATGGADAYALSAASRRAATQASGPAGRNRVEHTVQAGDTFWDIAQAHGVNVRRLAQWNDMAPGDPLRVGQQLVVWTDGEQPANNGPGDYRVQRIRYTVRSGDSLYVIARRFNVSVNDIRQWNGIAGQQYLQPGQQLVLHVDVTSQADSS